MEHWEKIAAVQKMQNYIHQHIYEPITLKMLASAADYSPWYAAKIFKDILGKPPFEYIRSLRLSYAASVYGQIDIKKSSMWLLILCLILTKDSHVLFQRNSAAPQRIINRIVLL